METTAGIDYVRGNDRAVLATTRGDGTPQMSPVTLAVVDETIVLSTRETAFKVTNLRRDPRAWLCVFPEGWYGSWVQLGCIAEIVSLPEAMDGLVDYYRTLRGEHPDWEEYRAAMRRPGKSLLRITPVSWGPVATGGFPPERAPA